MRAARAWSAVACLAAAAACAADEAPTPTPSPVERVEVAAAPDAAAPVAPAPDAGPVAPPPVAPPPVAADDGADFTAEAKLLYRVAACGGDAPLPAAPDAERVAKIVEHHCARLRKQADEYRERYFVGGRAFFDELVPDDVPRVVVYPFGGGDLVSALVAFPDATEITTISLELAGDPRRITTLPADRLEDSLAALRVEIGGMLQVGSNTSENLSASQDNDLPAQVSSFLMGLAAGGYEPVGMRYFRLADDGSIDYLDADEIAAIEAAAAPAAEPAGAGKRGKRAGGKAAKRKSTWVSPNFSEAFAHVELRYRKLDDPPGVVRVHRHLGWNLHDDYLAAHPELIRHLDAKGKVTLLTKGASYLLWQSSFSTIRDAMIRGLSWMLSDSTGIPPEHARKAGLTQTTYGTYTGAFLPTARGTRHDQAFKALWAEQPRRRLPLRFGYTDVDKHAHVVVTNPAAP